MPLHADVDELDEPLRLGDASGVRTPGRFIGGAASLVRLYAGRSVSGAGAGEFELVGVEAGELNMFGG